MNVTIRIPTALRSYAGGQGEVSVEADDVAGALDALVERHPDLRRHLYDDDGALRNFVNTYLNEDDVRFIDGGATPVGEGDTLTIVPSIAGGADGSPTGSAAKEAGAEPTNAAAPGSQSSRPAPASPANDGDPRSAIGDRSAAVPAAELSVAEIQRYSRHLIMPEVGLEGQKRLKQARVLMVGAGGLGSPLGLYLAAAGVGTLGIVDFDVVDETNLQRQLLHGTGDVGRPKLDSARDRLREVNPNVTIEGHETRLTSENALEILADYDIVIDGTDNFPTRYLVNDACVLLGKPNVYGSIFRFEGQVSVFWAEHGPCYRCLFREPPPPGLVPSCAEGGVLGVLPGIIGSLQALEAIKLIIRKGEPLIGRLLLFDALQLRWRELKLRKDPGCPVCGENPTVTELIDYERFCGIPQAEAEAAVQQRNVAAITPVQLQERLERGDDLRIIDVREPHEWDIVNLGDQGARLIPLGQLPAHMNELDSADEIVLYCRSGARSATAVRQLQGAGFAKLWNLEGGILAWADDVDRSMPKY